MARGLPKKRQLAGVEHVVLVASGKGGVGKSTTAVNLALSLRGLRVGLLDADVFGPSLPTMLNLASDTERPMVDDATGKMIPFVNYGLKCMSMGFLVPRGDPVVWRGPMVMGALEKLVHGTDWSGLDVLVVDTPPGTGDVHLTLAQTLQVSGAVVVTTPQEVAMADARKGTAMFDKMSIPVLGLVENMAAFVCGHCGTATHVFGKEGATKELAKEISAPLLASVPLDPSVMAGADSGKPIVLSHPNSLPSQAYKSAAEKLLKELNMDASGIHSD